MQLCTYFWAKGYVYNCFQRQPNERTSTNCLHFRAITLLPHFTSELRLVLFIMLLEASLRQFFFSSFTTACRATCGKQKRQPTKIKKAEWRTEFLKHDKLWKGVLTNGLNVEVKMKDASL
jgi:hypothetical protein